MPATKTKERAVDISGDDGRGDDEHGNEFGFFTWPGGKYGINFGTHEPPKDIMGGSSYVYFLIPNMWSFLVALVVVAFQMYLFWILWLDAEDTSNEEYRENKAEFTVGLTGACLMLTLRVLPQIGRAMELLSLGLGLTWRFAHLPEFRKKEFDAMLAFVGLVELFVGVSCVCVGLRFSLNKGSSVIRTITNATVAVFIAGIDEHMHSFLGYWGRPGWLRWAEKQLEKNYGSRPE